MELSSEQRSRVEAALHCERHQRLERVRALATPLELHHFVLDYNVNDGLDPIWHIIRSPLCDAGTALTLYWRDFHELLFEPPDEREPDPEQPNWDDAGLFAELEHRYLAGAYTHRSIACDPRAMYWTEFLQAALLRGELYFPEAVLEPTPGAAIERLWL